MDKDKKYILNLPEWKERISEPVPVPVCQSQSQCKCDSSRARASVPEPVCQSQCASASASVPVPVPDKNNNNNKDKEKGKGSEEASRETALRAGTRTGKCSMSTSSGGKIPGVCHYFQTANGCSHGDQCHFEHKKLSDKAAKELKSHMVSCRAVKEKISSAENSSGEEKYSLDQQHSESAKVARTKLTARKERNG